MKATLYYMLILMFSLLTFDTIAQNTNPCKSEAHQQFDFWVGEWDVYDAHEDTLLGQSDVKQILNSCAIEESWNSIAGFKGKSFNTYHPADSTWNRVWVDMSGVTYHFSGGLENGAMHLAGSTMMNGKEVWFNLTFTPNKKEKTVRQIWKLTYDKENWATLFDGIYRKREKKKEKRKSGRKGE